MEMEENKIINLSNNNNILIDISSKLEEIMDVLEDTNISNKMRELLNLINKVIDDNTKIFDEILNVNNDNELMKEENEEINEIINKNNNHKKP